MQLKLPAFANIIGLCLILSLALVFFYPTFFFGFIFDDWGDLFNSYGSISARLKEFLPTNGDFRAVTRLFWWLDYQLFGTEPLGYHLLNFAIHLLIIVMVWHLVRLLTKNDWVALCAAFLFSINKITITPVSWVSAAIDQKMLLFGLLAVFLYIRTVRTMAVSGKYSFTNTVVFTFAAWLAFKSKLMAWPLPGMYLLIDIIYLSSAQDFKARIIESTLRWIKLIWPLLILTLIYIPNFLSWAGPINSSGEYGVSLNPINLFASWGKYSASALGMLGYSSSSAAIFGGVVVFAVLLYGIIVRNRDILFGMLWFFITLIPVGILTKHHFDHHLYLPLIGLVMAFASLIYDISVKIRIPMREKSAIAIFSVIVFLYASAMHPFFKEWVVQTQDASALSKRTLTQIHEIVPVIPEKVTFFVYPTPKFSLLNYSAPLNFLYQQFLGITTKVFDNQLDFENATLSPGEKAWYALRYNPSDGSVALVKSYNH